MVAFANTALTSMAQVSRIGARDLVTNPQRTRLEDLADLAYELVRVCRAMGSLAAVLLAIDRKGEQRIAGAGKLSPIARVHKHHAIDHDRAAVVDRTTCCMTAIDGGVHLGGGVEVPDHLAIAAAVGPQMAIGGTSENNSGDDGGGC